MLKEVRPDTTDVDCVYVVTWFLRHVFGFDYWRVAEDEDFGISLQVRVSEAVRIEIRSRSDPIRGEEQQSVAERSGLGAKPPRVDRAFHCEEGEGDGAREAGGGDGGAAAGAGDSCEYSAVAGKFGEKGRELELRGVRERVRNAGHAGESHPKLP